MLHKIFFNNILCLSELCFTVIGKKVLMSSLHIWKGKTLSYLEVKFKVYTWWLFFVTWVNSGEIFNWYRETVVGPASLLPFYWESRRLAELKWIIKSLWSRMGHSSLSEAEWESSCQSIPPMLWPLVEFPLKVGSAAGGPPVFSGPALPLNTFCPFPALSLSHTPSTSPLQWPISCMVFPRYSLNNYILTLVTVILIHFHHILTITCGLPHSPCLTITVQSLCRCLF